MHHDKWTKKVEAFHDGEVSQASGVEAHLATCPQCRAHLARLESLRLQIRGEEQGARIEDPQFPAFMDGIRDQMRPPRSHRRGFLAAASLSLAALVMAISAFVIFSGPTPVKATEVESASTELEGATIDWYSNEDGVTTVQLTLPEDDLW